MYAFKVVFTPVLAANQGVLWFLANIQEGHGRNRSFESLTENQGPPDVCSQFAIQRL